MVALEAVDIHKSFTEGGDTVEVLKGISLSLEAGEIVALEGPSGSGKTTLLSILGCILTPTGGQVRIAGAEVDWGRPARMAALRRQSVGFVFQQFNLFPSLTARENVEYALNIKGIRGRTAHEQAEQLLDAVSLADRCDFLPRDLSGGQKQRVAIARALGGDPAVLLADEPTANLDSQAGMRVLHLFQQLARDGRHGLLIVTHDPNVRPICDSVLQIRDGGLATAAMAAEESA
jgi:putative ABC transport system ATP-binding protein